jgi:hypothetical protein
LTQIKNNLIKAIKNLLKIIIKKVINNDALLKIIPHNLILTGRFQKVQFLKTDFFNNSKGRAAFYKKLFNSPGLGSYTFEEGYWPSIHNHSQSIAGYVPYIKNQTSSM